MSFRLVPKSVTLNDLERRNGPYFALFFLPNLVISGAYCVQVVDKAITMDNRRLLCLVVNACRETARRPRYKYSITARWKFCSRFINLRLKVQYSPSYRFDKKSYMSFRLVQIFVTLNDLGRRNGPHFALFHRIRVRCHRRTIVRLTSVSKSGFDSL